MKETIKALEPLIVAVLAVVFGCVALALGYDGVVIMSVFGILGAIVGYELRKNTELRKVLGKAKA